MTLPAPVSVELRFTGGPSFGNVLVLGDPDDGLLGANVLGTSAAKPVDVTDQVQQVSIRRGRNDVIDSYNNGTATIQLLDTTGAYNPDNTASPYFEQILPNRQVRIYATFQGTKRFLFSGFVESWDYRWRPAFDAAVVTIVASDAFRLFNLADITTVTGAVAGDTTGQRINKILDAANWPDAQRQITGDGSQVQADSGDTRTTLAALQQVEASELGAFYIDGAGNAVFETRPELSQRAVKLFPPFFNDVLPPDQIPLKPGIGYQQLEVVLNDQLLANDVTVERVGGTPQTVSDTDSIQEFFRRSLSRTDTLNIDDTTALGLANAILQNRKDVGPEVKSLTFEMVTADNLRINTGLNLTFGDPIEVRRRYAGNTFVTALLTVQGIEHNITQGRHDVTLTTSRPLSFAFVLGSFQYGVLGQSTL